jgi:hypothetical protein
MSLVDRTNEEIVLSQHRGALGEPEGSVNIDIDWESSREPADLVWLMFYAKTPGDASSEPWIRLTVDEAEKVYDRLGRCLGKAPQ